jgi:DNA-binding CsgD family transcriptional regulator
VYGGDRRGVLRLAELAWSDGAPLEPDALDRLSWPMLTAALLFADELERDLEICDVALAAGREHDSPVTHSLASFCRAWPLYECGRIAEAAAAAHAALDVKAPGWLGYVRTAYGAIACCHLQGGQLEQAETALSIIDHPDVRESAEHGFLLDVRAQLRLAQLRPRMRARTRWRPASSWSDGSAASGRAGSPGARPRPSPTRRSAMRAAPSSWPPRSSSRLVPPGSPASSSATCECSASPRAAARASSCSRRPSPPAIGIRRASSTSAHCSTSAPRCAGPTNRAAAREPLRRALELSHKAGAVALDKRARGELAAAGARPRRAMLSGLESLTPSERRVAEVAATGLTTRQIAETLFVSPKTVEFHLRHVYQKLDIAARAELRRLLSGEE